MFYIELASDVPSNCVGIGGAPGESVYLKAGVSLVEPVPMLEGNDVRLNVDKGNQAGGGADASVIGNIANGLPVRRSSGPVRHVEAFSPPSYPGNHRSERQPMGISWNGLGLRRPPVYTIR